MITLAILLLLGLALIVFTIISVVVVGSVGFVIFGDIIVAVLIIAWIIRCIAKKELRAELATALALSRR